MSQDERFKPIQPPVTTTAAYSDRTMAQVQRPPRLPTLNSFTGYTPVNPQHERESPSFPALSPHDHGLRMGPRLPPIQLPPLMASHPPTSDPLAISNLLSRNPDSPGRRRYQRLPFQPSRQPTASPASSYSDSSNIPSHPPPPPSPHHYFDHPPPPPRPMTHPHHQQHQHFHHQQPPPPQPSFHQPPPPQPLDPSRHRQPSNSTSQYSASHSSTASSPATTMAPPLPVPPPRGPPPVNYTLSIRQQPSAARACGFGERDRRVVDPPPILELKITDKTTGHPASDLGCILALHCTLLSHDGSDETEVTPTADGMSATRRLMGTIVASPYQAKDENGVAGTFFVFPDLSCRSPGQYKLRFKLLRVDLGSMKPGGVSPSVASAVSESFSVFTAKDFPGMRASSALLKALRRQGLNVGVKKGSEARKGKGKGGGGKVGGVKKGEYSEEEEEDEERSEGSEEGSGDEEMEDVGRVAVRGKRQGKRRRVGVR